VGPAETTAAGARSPGMNPIDQAARIGVRIGTAAAIVLATVCVSGGTAMARDGAKAHGIIASRSADDAPTLDAMHKELAKLQADLAATKAEIARLRAADAAKETKLDALRSDVSTHDHALTELLAAANTRDASAEWDAEWDSHQDSFDDPTVWPEDGSEIDWNDGDVPVEGAMGSVK
jgi:septal ring factor EnvC (AmiA/AmiB activator)